MELKEKKEVKWTGENEGEKTENKDTKHMYTNSLVLLEQSNSILLKHH